ncbi:MAG: DUF5702 domain-containing protein [Clostridiales Family XIII bacterium]|nr:DUF5702 domain-containing protein [Clostridiales Family XIII bacterium]
MAESIVGVMKMRKIAKSIPWRKVRRFSRGAITIFLAVLLTPFITVALMLVQTANYNTALSAFDEAMGLSANATLAHYDDYLQKRFGLYAMDQSVSMQGRYLTYFETNAQILANSVAAQNTAASGQYPLSDAETLRRQLMEFNKFAAPTELAVETLNIQELIDKLESLGNLDDILGMLNSGLSTANTMKAAYDHLESAKTHSQNLEASGGDSLKGKYNTAYNDLKTAVSKLSDALPEPEAEPSPGDYADEESYQAARTEYDEKMDEIKNLRQAVKDAKLTCLAANQNLQNEISAHSQDANQFRSDIADLYDSATGLAGGPPLYDAVQSAYSETIKGMSTAMNNYNTNTAQPYINGLTMEYGKILAIDASADSISALDDAAYHGATVSGYLSSSEIDHYFEEQKKQFENDSVKSLIDGIVNLYNSVFNMNTIFDPAYSANIDSAYYESIGGMPGSVVAESGILDLFNSIGRIIDSASGFAGSILTLNIFGAIVKIIELINSILDFFNALASFVADIITNINELVSSYYKLYLSTYSAYNMPCRLEKKAKMTNFAPDLPAAPAITAITGIGGLAALADAVNAAFNESGNDLAFNGAEVEYMLLGSNSEVTNQTFVFAEIYLLRLLLDIIPVVSNPEVHGMAAATGPLAPIVYAAEILGEPLADTLLLVSGQTAPLIKTRVHLTPSGLASFAGKFLNEGLLGIASLDTGSDGLLPMNYRDHCFVLLLLTVTNAQQVARIANIAQMEGSYHYRNHAFTFKLSEAYTFVHATSDAKIKQFMPSLMPESLFTGTRTQYRGY